MEANAVTAQHCVNSWLSAGWPLALCATYWTVTIANTTTSTSISNTVIALDIFQTGVTSILAMKVVHGNQSDSHHNWSYSYTVTVCTCTVGHLYYY